MRLKRIFVVTTVLGALAFSGCASNAPGERISNNANRVSNRILNNNDYDDGYGYGYGYDYNYDKYDDMSGTNDFALNNRRLDSNLNKDNSKLRNSIKNNVNKVGDNFTTTKNQIKERSLDVRDNNTINEYKVSETVKKAARNLNGDNLNNGNNLNNNTLNNNNLNSPVTVTN